jgi:hypothetical protein
MKIGDTWKVRTDRFKKDGFALGGGGFVLNDDFKTIGFKVKRSTERTRSLK